MIGGFGVGDGDEALDPAGFRIAGGEELLMLFHRGLQHLGRQIKELVGDAAHQRHGPFDQTRHLGQQGPVFDHLHPGGKGKVLGGLPDGLFPLGAVKDHMGAFQFRGVIVKIVNGEAAGREEAMARCGVSGRDVIDGDGDNPVAFVIRQTAEDRVQRADPAQLTAAPAHGFGPGEGADGGFQHLGDDLLGPAAGFFDHRKEGFALFIGAAFQLVQRQAGGAQEAVDGLLRRGGGRALAFLAGGFRFRRQTLDGEREATGGGEGAGGSIG